MSANFDADTFVNSCLPTPETIRQQVEKTAEESKGIALKNGQRALKLMPQLIANSTATTQARPGGLLGRFSKTQHRKDIESLQKLHREITSLNDELEKTESRDIKKIDVLYKKIQQKINLILKLFPEDSKSNEQLKKLQGKLSQQEQVLSLKIKEASRKINTQSNDLKEKYKKEAKLTQNQFKAYKIEGNAWAKPLSKFKDIYDLRLQANKLEKLENDANKLASKTQNDFETLAKMEAEVKKSTVIREIIEDPKQNCNKALEKETNIQKSITPQSALNKDFKDRVSKELQEHKAVVTWFQRKYPNSIFRPREADLLQNSNWDDRDNSHLRNNRDVQAWAQNLMRVPTFGDASKLANAMIAIQKLEDEIRDANNIREETKGSMNLISKNLQENSDDIIIPTQLDQNFKCPTGCSIPFIEAGLKELHSDYKKLKEEQNSIKDALTKAKTASDYQKIKARCQKLEKATTLFKNNWKMTKKFLKDPEVQEKNMSQIMNDLSPQLLSDNTIERNKAQTQKELLNQRLRAISSVADKDLKAYVVRISGFKYILSEDKNWTEAETKYYKALEKMNTRAKSNLKGLQERMQTLTELKQDVENRLHIALNNATGNEDIANAWNSYLRRLKTLTEVAKDDTQKTPIFKRHENEWG